MNNNVKNKLNKVLKVLKYCYKCVQTISPVLLIISVIIIVKLKDDYYDSIKRYSSKETGVYITGVDTNYINQRKNTKANVVNEDNCVSVKGFSINNILGFTNFKTSISTKGNCLGIALLEKKFYLSQSQGLTTTYSNIRGNTNLNDFRGSQEYFYRLFSDKSIRTL